MFYYLFYCILRFHSIRTTPDISQKKPPGTTSFQIHTIPSGHHHLPVRTGLQKLCYATAHFPQDSFHYADKYGVVRISPVCFQLLLRLHIRKFVRIQMQGTETDFHPRSNIATQKYIGFAEIIIRNRRSRIHHQYLFVRKNNRAPIHPAIRSNPNVSGVS